MNVTEAFSILNAKIKDFCTSLDIIDFQNEGPLYDNQFDCLVFFLLHVLSEDNSMSSVYSSYINTLPIDLDVNLLFLQDVEINLIHGSLIYNEWERLMDLIQKYNQKLSKISIFNNKFQLGDLAYCFYIIETRHIGIEIDKKLYIFLIPFIDLINYDKQKINAELVESYEENKFIFLKASQDINKGEEIFIDYDEKCNLELFLTYGFTLAENDAPIKAENLFLIKLYDQYFYVNLYADNSKGYLKKALQDIIEKLDFVKIMNNYEDYLSLEMQFYEEVRSEIKFNINTQRLENLRDKTNKTKILIDIERALIDEQILLERNLIAVEELIAINKLFHDEFKTTGRTNIFYLDSQNYLDHIIQKDGNHNKNVFYKEKIQLISDSYFKNEKFEDKNDLKNQSQKDDKQSINLHKKSNNCENIGIKTGSNKNYGKDEL